MPAAFEDALCIQKKFCIAKINALCIAHALLMHCQKIHCALLMHCSCIADTLPKNALCIADALLQCMNFEKTKHR